MTIARVYRIKFKKLHDDKYMQDKRMFQLWTCRMQNSVLFRYVLLVITDKPVRLILGACQCSSVFRSVPDVRNPGLNVAAMHGNHVAHDQTAHH